MLIKHEKFFTVAESEDYADLEKSLRSLIINIQDFNNIVGFIGDFKNDYNVFKVKYLNKKDIQVQDVINLPKKKL